MDELIFEAIAQGGYLGIFLLMVLENVVPPVPSELIMGLGGVLVARGALDYWPLLAIASLGSTAGNYFWYWVGHRCGYRRLEPFIARHGRWLTVTFDDVEKGARFFQRHGQWVVFVLRFSPVLRTIVSLPAGLAHMPLWKFLTFTLAGTAVWNAILIEGGRRLAPLIDRYDNAASLVIAGSVVLFAIWYIYRVVTWKPREQAGD